MTATQLLRMKTTDANDAGVRALSRIESSGQRMVRMIDQLLDFTLIRTGLPIDPQPGDLVAILSGVIDEIRLSHPQQTIRFTHQGEARGNFDADRLGQAFGNVLGNAAQHGQLDAGVDVALDATGDAIAVTIHNAGTIPPELLPHVFEPMSGNKRKRDGSRGLGLGLFITQQIVQTHGGTVAVTSTDADGTRFIVTLPRDAHRAVTRPRPANELARHNELLLRMLVESARDYAMFVIDREGHVQTWNRGAELIKLYAPDEIIGRHISTFYTDEDRARDLPGQLLRRATLEGRVENEGWRIRKDGTRFWADVVITALRDQTGELYGFAKVTRDLSEQRLAEEQIRRSEERFRMLVDGVKDYAIFMLDPDGLVATWNAGAERIKGFTAREIIGKHFSIFYDVADVRSGKCERELAIAIAEGRYEEEGWLVRKDGTKFWASLLVAALRDERHELRGFAKITRDLTDRRKAELAQLELAQAHESIRLRDEFLSIVSHELKTPLAGLQLQLDSLGDTRTNDPKLANKLERATTSSRRLSQLIESLLDVSRIATGRFVLRFEHIDLGQVISEVVDSFRPAATRSGCELVTNIATIHGSFDRVRIAQVAINVLSNAVKYGAGKPVEVTLRRDGNDAVLEIRDHGPGIAAADLQRIFERFERAAATRHFGGLGIGLYVVREIVLAHGGDVAANSKEGDGACFMVRLPVDKPEMSSI
jgi:PAS domain S-box-containing protein